MLEGRGCSDLLIGVMLNQNYLTVKYMALKKLSDFVNKAVDKTVSVGKDI